MVFGIFTKPTNQPARPMALHIDQMGNKIELDGPPRRIVSLVPSLTELLFDLGMNETVVGITRYCIHPEPKVKGKTRIGGTKNPDLDQIRALRPDLIIGNKEENRQEDIETLQKEFPVWMSDINSLADATRMIRQIGHLLEKEASGDWIAGVIESRFAALPEMLPPGTPRVAYLIWRNPWMVAGASTFINALLTHCGWVNAFGDQERYPQCTATELRAVQPDIILLSSEPYPFQKKHIDEIASLCPRAKVRLVRGDLFSWYGSRLLRTPTYVQSLRPIRSESSVKGE
jgi:ABC-type Fe3+-hydroxamate transport system substrate-binding protein